MEGFRSLAPDEEVMFDCQMGKGGLEAICVQAPEGELQGAQKVIPARKPVAFRKIRCYNCGSYGNHIATRCTEGPQPKRCHRCKSDSHLIADCPGNDLFKLGVF